MSVGASSGDKERGQSLIESWWRVVAQWYWWALCRRHQAAQTFYRLPLQYCPSLFMLKILQLVVADHLSHFFCKFVIAELFFFANSLWQAFCRLPSDALALILSLSLSEGVAAAVASLVYTHLHIVIRGLSSVFVFVFVSFCLSLSLSDWVLAQQWCRRPSGVLAAA